MKQQQPLLSTSTCQQFGVPANIADAPQLADALAAAINLMILHQYDRLIQLLYRMDISEKKLTTLLQQHSQTDAGRIIAALVIEREQQKIASRAAHQKDSGETEDVEGTERW